MKNSCVIEKKRNPELISKNFSIFYKNIFDDHGVKYCKTNERQHGFKKNHSTMTAFFILKETIFSYILKNSFVYAAFLNLTKNN